MALESASFFSQLVSTNPAHTDGLNQADAHLRLIKSVIQNQFPNFTAAALESTNSAIDAAVSLLTGVSGAAAFPAGSAGAPSISFTGDPDSGWYSPGEDQVALSLNGTQVAIANTTGLAVTASFAATNVNSVGPYSGGTGQLCPVGAILMYQGSSPPTGWAWLNGQIISATANPGLAAIYGATGGNTTLPDWRDYVPIGVGNMGGTSDRGLVTLSGIDSMNASVGEAKHTLVVSECPTGLLTFNDVQHSHGVTIGGSTWFGANTFGNYADNAGPNSDIGGFTQAGITINSAFTGCSLTDHGGNGAHNNTQLSVTTGFIIKLG